MSRSSRRHFLMTAAAVAASARVSSSTLRAWQPNSQVHIACVGVGGKGESDMMETSAGHQIVAICDIDEQRLAKAVEKFPNAKRYTDWRKMLEQKDIDAVTISTPDHMHAPVTMSAIERGKHVFTQKPLTHSVFEARQLAQAAKQAQVVTQMGIQHHATARLKTAVQILHGGLIGKVNEVHAWTDRPGTFWKQGLQRPSTSDPVPGHVHWDLWLGVASERPFVADLYHPFHWRGWWDFGTGALGDMGCHILDPVIGGLELGPPRTVWAEGPKPDAESGPLWCIVHWEFPGTSLTTENLHLTWYEAGKKPPRELFKAPADWKGSENGVLYVGEKGNLFVGFPEPPELFPKGEFSSYQLPDIADHNHYTEWTSAIAGNGKTSCPFSYSGPLTETVLLGNVAYRAQSKLNWDSRTLTATNVPEANRLVRRPYRDGWQVAGL